MDLRAIQPDYGWGGTQPSSVEWSPFTATANIHSERNVDGKKANLNATNTDLYL